MADNPEKLIKQLESSISTLTRTPHFNRLIPEVGSNFVACLPHATKLSQVAGLTGRPLLPSPPTVVVDMLTNVLDVFIPKGERDGELMVMETELNDTEGLVRARFWVLPDLAS